MNDTNSPFSQSIEVEGIGSIKIRRRRGQKSTTLRLGKGGGVVLSTNYSTPLYSLKKFVVENRSWLEEARAKSGLAEEVEILDRQILAPGLEFCLVHKPGLEKLLFKYRKGWDRIEITTSSLLDSVKLDEASRQELEVLVVKALRERAQEYLLVRLAEISDIMDTDYNSVTIRNTSSRWGSCSSRNDINLSLWLMILPKNLIDYVIIHELAHTRFKHHGKEFWHEVNSYCPGHKELRAKLKKHSGQVWW